MISTQAFGSTGHQSTRVIFGAAALGRASSLEETQPTLDVLLEHGLNHIDTAAAYGRSERRIGEWMRDHRDRFFLATKTGERTYEKARDQFRHSLERLQVPSVDLLQLHNLVDPGEWETALGPGGALQAAVEAREQGLTRFIGVTGHGVTIAAMHKRSLEKFDFDSVLLPYNYPMMQNEQYVADFEALLALCQQRNVAVQTIKAIAYRPWMGRSRTASTWYEPLSSPEDIELAIHWALGRSGIFVISVGDVELLPHVLAAAERFTQTTSDEEMSQLVRRLEMEPLFV